MLAVFFFAVSPDDAEIGKGIGCSDQLTERHICYDCVCARIIHRSRQSSTEDHVARIDRV